MKKISYFSLFVFALLNSTANASYDDNKFKAEIAEGLDLVVAEDAAVFIQDEAPGELGREVYEVTGAVNQDDTRLFVPTTNYLRMGGGINIGDASSKVVHNGEKFNLSDSYSVQIGLGWNLSSYVRAELDFQMSEFTFSGLDNLQATQHTLGGMLYFDFVRRYVHLGDITKRRTFIPYMGIGAGFGTYDYQGKDGKDGLMIAAPQVAMGVNLMLTDLIGIDVMYQYKMIVSNGFGWGAETQDVNNISNVMTSIRMNF